MNGIHYYILRQLQVSCYYFISTIMVIVSIVNRLDLKQWPIRSYSSWRGDSRQCVDTHCNCCYVIDLPYTSVNLV